MRFRNGWREWAPASFNDTLALVFLLLVVGLWVVQGLGLISLRDDANGALTVLVTLVIQFYFRRAKTEA